MALPRLDGSTSNATSACPDPSAAQPSRSADKPLSATAPVTGCTVESFSRRPGFDQAPSAPLAGPTSNASRFELEQALAKQELLEAAMRELTPILQTSAKLKGRIDGATFITDWDQTKLVEALQKLPANELQLAVFEAVQRAFPKANAAKVNELVSDTMRQLERITTDTMARELKDFVADSIKTGAVNFREAAKDPAKLEAMLGQLSRLTGTERKETLQALGLDDDVRQPTAQQLANALTARAALMERSAKALGQTSGKDTILFKLAGYPGMSELFAQKKKLDPTSVAARALEQATKDAEAEKSLRAKGDFVLAVTSAVAFGAVAAAASLGTMGAVAVAAPATLANTARKAGEEENSVNNTRAGTSAGVLSSDAITAAENHRTAVMAGQTLELAGPIAGHFIGKAVHLHSVAGHAALEGGVATAIIGGEKVGAHLTGHAHGTPRGRDATSK